MPDGNTRRKLGAQEVLDRLREDDNNSGILCEALRGKVAYLTIIADRIDHITRMTPISGIEGLILATLLRQMVERIENELKQKNGDKSCTDGNEQDTFWHALDPEPSQQEG